MSTPLDNIFNLVSAEADHSASLSMCFVYFGALAETRRRGHPSDLFESVDLFAADLPRDCDEVMAARLQMIITDFIEKCPNHPLVVPAFQILFDLSVGTMRLNKSGADAHVIDLKSYFISKLKLYYGQGDAFPVHTLCTVLGDLGIDIFRDEKGNFIQSRGSCEAETNMGVARRFLERHNAQP